MKLEIRVGDFINQARLEETVDFARQANHHEPPPEKPYIETLKKHAAGVNDPDFVLNAFALTSSLAYAGDSHRFYRRISNPRLIEQYQWIFHPETVVQAKNDAIGVEDFCEEFFGPQGYNGKALKQWVHNCRVLCDKFDGSFRGYFSHYQNDAQAIVDALVVRVSAKTYEKPDMRTWGPKLSRYLVQTVDEFGLHTFDNVYQPGPAVDFHLVRLLQQTEALNLPRRMNVRTVTSFIAQPAYSDYCVTRRVRPFEVANAMYLTGSRNCRLKNHSFCPIERLCTSLIVRETYDDGGTFSPPSEADRQRRLEPTSFHLF